MAFPDLQQLQALIAKHYQINGSLTPLPGEADHNFQLQKTEQERYLIKLSATSTTSASLPLRNAILHHLEHQHTSIQLPRIVPTVTGEDQVTLSDGTVLRLITWMEGELWVKVHPKSEGLLESLGVALGQLSKALANFDHPEAHWRYWWNPSEALQAKDHLYYFQNPEQKKWITHFLDLFEQHLDRIEACPKAVNHNDANDYNIIVSQDKGDRKVVGFIDFGDVIYTQRINEVAIALAYAMMDTPDPLRTAIPVLRGYHQISPILPEELEVLFPLIAARLVISITTSIRNQAEQPDNSYLQVSNQPALTLLEQLYHLSPAFAHYTFRYACGYLPCPAGILFQDWVVKNARSFAPVVPVTWTEDAVALLDLTVGSLALGNNPNFEDDQKFEASIHRLLAEQQANVGVGGYNETRPFYTTDRYTVIGNDGPQWRTVHLGLDIWMVAQTPVFAPVAGTVFAKQNNAFDRDYGPTIILRHEMDAQYSFYTLYGHLSPESLELAPEVGQPVHAGQQIAWIGARPHNGNWPPHLHFQVMLDMLGNEGDFPGVAFPHEKEIWLSLCPDPNLLLQIPQLEQTTTGRDHQTIIDYRKQHLGPNMSMSYQQPLKMVRGYKQYLYEADGRRYLDTVNNVPHVGHQHPRVVEAAQRQIAVLNTNTRYLHDGLIDYTEALLQRFPKPLEVVYFVTSGSEANELALRMAQAYSQQQNMLVLEAGYHGHTTGTVGISSYKFDGKGGHGAPGHVHKIPMPDLFRGRFRGNDPEASTKYAKLVTDSIARLRQQGQGIAGFIHESILSCGGQIVLPKGYLQQVYPAIRAAGGLCIADEVQVGFGRVGNAFWGFELQGVVPDIVTLGKPIGNGHPMGAVVTTRAVADAFANGMEFFSTFGGNPVSCAIGKAVLDIIEEEDLQQHAQTTGQYLKDGLRALQSKFPIIGEVRGHGLFLGFELVDAARQPLAHQTAYLANRMRQRGILMSTDGPDYNVIKIKPPMCFDKRNADFLLDQLALIFKEDFMQQ
jgi:4-aminobutyrate aminotransferase-like enzyme/Ser/Thr protein kinase RdoA (MazF antagonist)